jgi:hypothetical protein
VTHNNNHGRLLSRHTLAGESASTPWQRRPRVEKRRGLLAPCGEKVLLCEQNAHQSLGASSCDLRHLFPGRRSWRPERILLPAHNGRRPPTVLVLDAGPFTEAATKAV